MPSLTQLLATHRCVLVLDTASSEVIAGLLTATSAGDWTRAPTDANRGIFKAVEELLHRNNRALPEVEAFAYCEGPGSSLGIRTAAMVLRAWNALNSTPCYAYQSLALAAVGEWTQVAREFAVIADARRESWHVQRVSRDGVLQPLARAGIAELSDLELHTPDTFRTWSTLPANTRTCRYDPATWLKRAGNDDLFALRAEPDSLQTAPSDYKKWSGQTHSAESSQR